MKIMSVIVAIAGLVLLVYGTLFIMGVTGVSSAFVFLIMIFSGLTMITVGWDVYKGVEK